MPTVSIRDLRNHGGEAVARAQRGEVLTITHSGKPVARLVALDAAPIPLETLREQWAKLPAVDPQLLRGDIDSTLDASV